MEEEKAMIKSTIGEFILTEEVARDLRIPQDTLSHTLRLRGIPTFIVDIAVNDGGYLMEIMYKDD